MRWIRFKVRLKILGALILVASGVILVFNSSEIRNFAVGVDMGAPKQGRRVASIGGPMVRSKFK